VTARTTVVRQRHGWERNELIVYVVYCSIRDDDDDDDNDDDEAEAEVYYAQ
jgi:hypothetical protein